MSLPWSTSSVDEWILNLLYTCVSPEDAEEIKPTVKELLFSNEDDDSIQFPLFELLGDASFEVIATLIKYRKQILEAYTSEPTPQPTKPIKETPQINVPLARKSRFTCTDSINATRYDVDAPHGGHPDVKHVPISDLPEWARSCFSTCHDLNDIQSTVFEEAFNTNDNMLVAAPTGAGKTNVALLTILHEIKNHIVVKPGLPSVVNSNDPFLIVYITPMKALATEIKEKFTNALRYLKVNVKEYTGDTRIAAAELLRSHLLVATPEKWDIATRKGGEDAPSSRIKLLIIDEIHLLQDDRGPVLEAIVARTLRQVEQSQSMIRIVGLSATLPNCHDVARFLRVPDPGLFIFGPEYRPVPLQMTLIGTKNTVKTPSDYQEIFEELYQPGKDKDVVQIDIVTMQLLEDILANGHQVLIFVHSRGETARFANLITKHLRIPVTETLNHLIARRRLQSQLRECLAKGVGIHHAGLPRADRIFIENAFKSNAFQILVCTATLAWGVNLPAHTCIIKDTKVYNQEHGGFEDIGILDVHQMFGRAGRPQFDASGHGILITRSKVLSKYTTTLVNAEPITSKFGERIEDFLNAEISLGTVTTKADALQWIRYTFMYQRCPDDLAQMQRIDNAATSLNENKMIRLFIATDSLQPTHLGQVASMHYIPFTAVKHFNENLTGDMDPSQLLDCIFSSGMFSSLIVRNNELDELSSFTPVITLLTPPDELPGKVNVLFQSYVSRHVFKTPSLMLDQGWIADNMQRVFDGIFELAIEQGWCDIAIFSLNLCKMVEQQMWWVPNRQDHPLLQILKGPKFNSLFRRLDKIDLTVEALRSMEFSELKAILRNDQDAHDASNAAKRFPVIELDANYQPMSDEIISIQVEVAFQFSWDKSCVHETEHFWLFIQDVEGENMYSAQDIAIDRRIAKDGLQVQVLVPLPQSQAYKISMTSVRYLGVEDSQQLNVTDGDKITFSRYVSAPPQLRPLYVDDVIQNSNTRKLFPFDMFNLIQTNLFFQTYHTDESVMLCAPTAAGKTVIAELTIAHLLETSQLAKVVYLAPLKSIVQERVIDWKKKFQGLLIELTGDFTPDSDAIAKSRIIIATPEKWDAVSRGFVVRQFVQYVSLLIIDEVHLLGTDRGHIIEAVVDRMKSIQKDLRVVALSTCLSNPLDVAQFLGVPQRGVYNFSPKLRNVPLRIFIRGFPGRHYCPRMAAMNKPISDAIIEHSRGKPTLVFVSSRRQTRLTAFDLISFASSSHNPMSYSTPETTAASTEVHDPDLQHCLSFGVGLHHAGLSQHDQKIVETLFGQGKMKILVATATLAWGVNLPAHFVIIKGTEFHDPKTCQWVPYSITEIQQMMGRAGRPQFDKEGIVMILCEESRKEFLKKFINSPFPVESSMLPNIDDHVNAEVATGRIRTKKALTEWINRSFFGLRLSKNPQYYQNVTVAEVADQTIQDLRLSHCITSTIDDDILPTAAGRIGSIFYVSHKTVRLFLDRMSEVTTVVDVLHLLLQAYEFKDTPVRHNEDDLVAQMTPRYKRSTDQNDSSYTKAFYLVQYYLSHRKMPIPDFETDCGTVLDNLLRIVGCFSELCATRNNLLGMINAILIGQMLVQGIWYDDIPLKCLVDEQTLRDLKKKDIKTLPQLLTMKSLPDRLKPICDRILLYSVLNKGLNPERTQLTITIKKINGVIGSDVISPHYLRKAIQSMYILIGDPESGELICHRRIQFKNETMTINLKSNKPIPENCWIYLMNDSYIGLDQQYSISETPIVTKLFLRPKKYVNFEKKKKSANPSYKFDPSKQKQKEKEIDENELFFGTIDDVENEDDHHEEEVYEDLSTTGKKGRRKMIKNLQKANQNQKQNQLKEQQNNSNNSQQQNNSQHKDESNSRNNQKQKNQRNNQQNSNRFNYVPPQSNSQQTNEQNNQTNQQNNQTNRNNQQGNRRNNHQQNRNQQQNNGQSNGNNVQNNQQQNTNQPNTNNQRNNQQRNNQFNYVPPQNNSQQPNEQPNEQNNQTNRNNQQGNRQNNRNNQQNRNQQQNNSQSNEQNNQSNQQNNQPNRNNQQGNRRNNHQQNNSQSNEQNNSNQNRGGQNRNNQGQNNRNPNRNQQNSNRNNQTQNNQGNNNANSNNNQLTIERPNNGSLNIESQSNNQRPPPPQVQRNEEVNWAPKTEIKVERRKTNTNQNNLFSYTPNSNNKNKNTKFDYRPPPPPQ